MPTENSTPTFEDDLKVKYPILRYFEYSHLPVHLQQVSQQFRIQAYDAAGHRPQGHPETAAGLRKLLEAKDCFVRAMLP